MFWGKEKKSTKELYLEKLNTITEDALIRKDYVIASSYDGGSKYILFNDITLRKSINTIYFPKLEDTYGNEEEEYRRGNKIYVIKKHYKFNITDYHNLSPICREIFNKYVTEQELKIDNEIQREKDYKKSKEDEEYNKKLKELLKIKPLDQDLQKTLKKSERLLEIARQAEKLRKEAIEIRNSV